MYLYSERDIWIHKNSPHPDDRHVHFTTLFSDTDSLHCVLIIIHTKIYISSALLNYWSPKETHKTLDTKNTKYILFCVGYREPEPNLFFVSVFGHFSSIWILVLEQQVLEQHNVPIKRRSSLVLWVNTKINIFVSLPDATLLDAPYQIRRGNIDSYLFIRAVVACLLRRFVYLKCTGH